MCDKMLKQLVLIYSLSVLCVNGEDPIVQISNGKIKGEVMVTPNNRSFYAFRGIPYAKPPIGELRFKPPQKADNWEGVLDSDAKNRMCIQLSSDTTSNESEDCLYIHVYTPQISSEKENVSLPVIYAIHGGAFVVGAPTLEMMGPEFLMDYDVVVVSVGYRLGFLGFLSTEDLNCPGNNGLKDQQFGLRWVQENIRQFGGDPERVTIFGESAGAASVGYQLLGSNADGLFIGAIQDSGSSLGNWALQREPKNMAYTFANQINATITEDNTSTVELLNFFRTLDIQQIKEACVELFGEGMVGGFYKTLSGNAFVGAIEPQHDGAFLSDLPYQKFASGEFNRVPTLIGVNSEECLFLAKDPTLKERMMLYNLNPDGYVLEDMHITDLETKQTVGNKIAEIYDPSGDLYKSEGLSVRYFSDTTFVRPSVKQAELQSKYTDVYFYEFGYSGAFGRSEMNADIPDAEKVVHSEEMRYLFHARDSKDINSFPEDKLTMRRMLTMWTNFVKYQNPTPEPVELLPVTWPKIKSSEEMPYLLINNTLQIHHNFKKEMIDTYQNLYDTYAVPPLDTY